MCGLRDAARAAPRQAALLPACGPQYAPAMAARPALSARAARVAVQAQAQTLRRVGRGGLHEEGGEDGGGGAASELLGVGARGEVGACPAASSHAPMRSGTAHTCMLGAIASCHELQERACVLGTERACKAWH